MKDQFDREITYLRVSITDRCNLRCRYCMPACGVAKRGHDDILSFEEIWEIVSAAAKLGQGAYHRRRTVGAAGTAGAVPPDL